MSSNKFVFTKEKLEATNLRGVYHDQHKLAASLTLSIQTDYGAKTFQIRKKLNGKAIKVVLGRFPDLTIEQARNKAREAINHISNGINPNEAKKAQRKKSTTLEEAFNGYLAYKNLKPTTILGYQTSFKNVLAPLAKREVVGITYNDILSIHKEYSKRSHSEADRAMRLLRAVFFYAMEEITDQNGIPLIVTNPVKKLFKSKQTRILDRRTRKLEDDQLTPFLDFIERMVTDSRPFFQTGADLLLTLTFHGTRFTETAKIKWTSVEMKYKRFWLDETKNGRRLWLPMNSYTYEVFKRRKSLDTGSEYVFPSVNDPNKHISDVKKPLRALLEETGIEITPHDLRRTFLGMGNRIGLSAYTLKQLSNHAISQGDVTAGYVIQSADELREHSQQITDSILRKADRQPNNTDNILIELIKDLSNEEKRKLIFQMSSQLEPLDK